MTSGVDILKVNLKSMSFGVRNANNDYAMQYVCILLLCITVSQKTQIALISCLITINFGLRGSDSLLKSNNNNLDLRK